MITHLISTTEFVKLINSEEFMLKNKDLPLELTETALKQIGI